MPRRPLPPVAVAVAFIDRINHGDLDGLAALMTDDHTLVVLDEDPLVGGTRTSTRGGATSRPSPRT
jgi:hypothetical protein